MRRRIRRSVLLAACLVGISVGISVGAVVPAAMADPPADPVPEAASNEGRQVVADDPSIVDGRPLHVDAWSRATSADAVSVQFSLGSPDCTGVHADVRETDQSVVVELRAGTRPAAVGRMCTMIVVQAALDVRLQSPLGNRTVLSAV